MIRSVIKFTLEGSSYKEILEKVNEELSGFLEIEKEKISRYVDCEIIFGRGLDKQQSSHYSCEVIARVRNYDV